MLIYIEIIFYIYWVKLNIVLKFISPVFQKSDDYKCGSHFCSLDSVCQMAFPNPGTMYKGRLTHLTVPEGDCMGRGHQLP